MLLRPPRSSSPAICSFRLSSFPAPPSLSLSLDESILIGRDGDGGLSRQVRGKAAKVMLVRLLEIKLSYVTKALFKSCEI